MKVPCVDCITLATCINLVATESIIDEYSRVIVFNFSAIQKKCSVISEYLKGQHPYTDLSSFYGKHLDLNLKLIKRYQVIETTTYEPM
jgi:hypothetical protein